ncbi:hypothetical protein [Mycoavidus sp. B2-EB]|uniref:hypothetical protein n=1 Tax=Mycoavidus sp. B2-EB TaxID=2651972 RepID=UPI001623B61B|nr:hypothetical protein [Mycoavidus sp. B2-EB]BBO59207.1 hypothetical protein MPB2EB_0313 [Mycoavidus sp. B2-EB]
MLPNTRLPYLGDNLTQLPPYSGAADDSVPYISGQTQNQPYSLLPIASYNSNQSDLNSMRRRHLTGRHNVRQVLTNNLHPEENEISTDFSNGSEINFLVNVYRILEQERQSNKYVKSEDLLGFLRNRLNSLEGCNKLNEEIFFIHDTINSLQDEINKGGSQIFIEHALDEFGKRINELSSRRPFSNDFLKKDLRDGVDSFIARINMCAFNEKSELPRDDFVGKVSDLMLSKNEYKDWRSGLKLISYPGQYTIKHACKSKVQKLFRNLEKHNSFFCTSKKYYDLRQNVVASLWQEHKNWKYPLRILCELDGAVAPPQEMQRFIKDSQKVSHWYRKSSPKMRCNASKAINEVSSNYRILAGNLRLLKGYSKENPGLKKVAASLKKDTKILKRKDFLSKGDGNYEIDELSDFLSSLKKSGNNMDPKILDEYIERIVSRSEAYDKLENILSSGKSYWNFMWDESTGDTFCGLRNSPAYNDRYLLAYQNWSVLTGLMQNLSSKFPKKTFFKLF